MSSRKGGFYRQRSGLYATDTVGPTLSGTGMLLPERLIMFWMKFMRNPDLKTNIPAKMNNAGFKGMQMFGRATKAFTQLTWEWA